MKNTVKPPSETPFDVFAALRARYPEKEWAYFEEIRNGTGFTRITRTADAMAFGLWPSRGLELHGFEVKRNRSDWKREKDEPEKAEELARFCDRWWLVVSDEKIVQDGELPPSWGLLVPRGGKLVAKVEAPKLEAQPLTRQFLAAIFRRVHEGRFDPKALNAETMRIEKELRDRYSEKNDARISALTAALETEKRRIADFEQRSGVRISDQWMGPKIGDAVQFVLGGGVKHARRELEHLKNQANRVADDLDRVLKQTPEGST